MTDQTNQSEQPKKKISLQEAIQQQLANKKSQLQQGKAGNGGPESLKKLKSQQTNKVMNARRRMGAK
jgi:hypothetical protein